MGKTKAMRKSNKSSNGIFVSKKNRRKIRKRRFKILSKIWALIYLAALIAFIGMIIWMDILPNNILLLVLAGLGIVTLILFPIMYFNAFKVGRKAIAMIVSTIFICGYVYGTINLQDTSKFFNEVTTVGIQTQDYYLIVRKDSSYEKPKALKDKSTGIYLTSDPNYIKAKKQLKSKVNLRSTVVKDLSKLDNGLMDRNYESIFVSAPQYTTMCQKVTGFKDKTRILYTVKVEVSQKNVSKKVRVTEQPFNIYISGLDVEGGIEQSSRSDVNMIVTVNPKTYTILLTSIPRDFEVRLSSYGNEIDKLTHTGIYGIQETIGSVEKLTGIDMNYFVKVNYTTVSSFVDAIGGIDVYSDYTFTTHGMYYQQWYQKGVNHLNGMRALAFARERKSFENGDVQRTKHQAKVLEAMIKKVSSSKTILSQYSTILNKCKPYMRINMSPSEIKSLVKYQLDTGGKWKIEKQNLIGHDVSETTYSTGDYKVYVMKPDKENLEKATKKIIEVMDEGR